MAEEDLRFGADRATRRDASLDRSANGAGRRSIIGPSHFGAMVIPTNPPNRAFVRASIQG
jgi:hypothetical protein